MNNICPPLSTIISYGYYNGYHEVFSYFIYFGPFSKSSKSQFFHFHPAILLICRVKGALGAVQLRRDALELRGAEVQGIAPGATQGPAGQVMGGGAGILTLTSGRMVSMINFVPKSTITNAL